MNIIKDSQTNAVLWYGSANAYVVNGVYRTDEYGLGIADSGVTYVENVPAVEYYFTGVYAYDNGWKIIDQQLYDRNIARLNVEYNSKQKENRAKAYSSESDSIFFKAQRGEATMQEWQDKVAEIKARFPYKE